jgi:SAM-dependent methyltransferase
VYSDIFCKVYNEFGWNYYPEIFGEELQLWMEETGFAPGTALDLACGTGILCRILRDRGIAVRGMDFSSGMIAVARENCPDIPFDVADMITYHPNAHFDLITCTGDAVNHIPELSDVEKIFRNTFDLLNPGGLFVFDILDEKEVSTSEPFEMDFSDTTRVWFRMTRPEENKVQLQIRVFEEGTETFSEIIRETIHDVSAICKLLQNAGFQIVKCSHRLSDTTGTEATTWFIIAKKEN